MRLFEDIVDNIDNVEQDSAARVVDDESSNKLPEYTWEEARATGSRCILCVEVVRPREISNEEINDVRDYLESLIGNFMYVDSYEVCRVGDDDEWMFRNPDKSFSIIFDPKPGYIMSYISGLMLPLYSFIYKNINGPLNFYLFFLERHVQITRWNGEISADMDDFERILQISTGKVVIKPNSPNTFHMIEPWMQIAYNMTEAYHDFHKIDKGSKLMRSFWDYLAWIIFKKEWAKQFKGFETADDGRKVVPVKMAWVDPKFWTDPKRKTNIPI